jgi:hypothetical protein
MSFAEGAELAVLIPAWNERENLEALLPATREVLERLGGRVLEIPFHYMPRGSGRSHTRLFKFGWAFLKTLLRMWRLRHAGAGGR